MTYKVWGGESTQTLDVLGGDNTEVIIMGLASTTTYAIEVAAVNSAGSGKYSSPITAATTVGKVSCKRNFTVYTS